jgi:hypothetical protein
VFEDFTGADELVTNEHASWHRGDGGESPTWEMTSGSLFRRAGEGWTGTPDAVEPDALSSNGTGSAIFRLTTKEADFGDVAVSFDLTNVRLSSTASTPPVDWDGVHVFLRYQSEQSLYYASVNRRDGSAVIKKKCVGGPDNGGTYYDLTPYQEGHPIPFGTPQHVVATAQDDADGSVTITLGRDGQTWLVATDRGVGCAPITQPGKVGIRGDNDEFTFDDFTVHRLRDEG